MQEISSWGNYFHTQSEIKPLYWLSDKLCLNGEMTYLPIGMARSYGDCCLNDRGALLSTRGLNRFLSFDQDSGILCCQSGVSLSEILDFAVPRNWFLPVSPGTKFVSLGGAIANDVHGKNHSTSGTFGENVIEFELLRSNGESIICSRDNNPDLFLATIAGLGLTGLILWAKIKLKPISSPYMQCKNIFFHSFEEFFEVSAEFSDKYEYSVAWMDCASKNSLFGRGIFMCADHSSEISGKAYSKKSMSVPLFFPSGLLNNLLVSSFNKIYFTLKEKVKHDFFTHYDPYFYPLDVVGSWNKVYGKKGFFQFQCVVPFGDGNRTAAGVFDILKKSTHSSYLTVVKEFSERKPSGLMSFPRKGLTICFDIPNRGAETLKIIKQLNDYACGNGGAIYPAKDACMSSNNFNISFPNINEFSRHLDSKFSSSFWRRVTDSI